MGHGTSTNHSGRQCTSLGTRPDGIARVFHIGSYDDGAVFGQQSGTDAEVGVGTWPSHQPVDYIVVYLCARRSVHEGAGEQTALIDRQSTRRRNPRRSNEKGVDVWAMWRIA